MLVKNIHITLTPSIYFSLASNSLGYHIDLVGLEDAVLVPAVTAGEIVGFEVDWITTDVFDVIGSSAVCTILVVSSFDRIGTL